MKKAEFEREKARLEGYGFTYIGDIALGKRIRFHLLHLLAWCWRIVALAPCGGTYEMSAAYSWLSYDLGLISFETRKELEKTIFHI